MNMEQTDPGWTHSQARDQILVHQGLRVFHADTHWMSLLSLVGMTTLTGKMTETRQIYTSCTHTEVHTLFRKDSACLFPRKPLFQGHLDSLACSEEQHRGPDRGVLGSSFKAYAPNL